MRVAKACVAFVASSLVLASACGGTVAQDDGCGPFFDQLAAMFAQCGAPNLLDPATRGAFVAYCGALAMAPGASDLASQYAACGKNLDPNLCFGPQCDPRGALAAGAACTDGAQCQSAFCVPTTPAGPNTEQMCGTCGTLGEQGASCGVGPTPCDSFADLYCSKGTCQPLLKQGASCANGEECRAELFCDAQTKTCQPLPTKGQACSGGCMAAYACIAGVCADRLGAGGSCPTGVECRLDLVCDPTSQVCVSGGAVGDACSTSNIVQCAAGLQCTKGVCMAPKLQGASCVQGNLECAAGLVCANGTCQVADFTLCK